MAAKRNRFLELLQFVAIFLLLYILVQFGLRQFFPSQFGSPSTQSGVVLKPQAASVKGDHSTLLTLENFTKEDLTLPDRCPQPPVNIAFVDAEKVTPLTSTGTAIPCVALTSVKAGEKVTIDLSPWKYSVLGRIGTYRATVSLSDGQTVSTNFSIYAPGPFTRLFRGFITKPLLNLLIFIASIIPGHSLGLSIIVLTILVKLLLFLPTQKGLESQKKLQAIQPKLDALKAQYKDDPKRMQEETMKIWKEHKVNPFQSCLPTLIQLPILIGLFFVIRDGSSLELSRHLIYPVYQHLTWSFETSFFGFDLLLPSVYVFPPLLVILQFLQMKLAFASAKKKAEEKRKEGQKPQPDAAAMQQRMMLYGLPLMIGFFAIKFPAAVSLYWGVSTLFAIAQQFVVNRRTA
ncbi:MAG: YidC/Oxa1 family membrane protein insertase [Candidatus Peribacteraceae bacterium]|nr:YidC/Oxa1 family membrane protein insertase [Candidatus Peribacteraceae bacterium]